MSGYNAHPEFSLMNSMISRSQSARVLSIMDVECYYLGGNDDINGTLKLKIGLCQDMTMVLEFLILIKMILQRF